MPEIPSALKDVDENQLNYVKNIGHIRKTPVYEFSFVGGLFLLVEGDKKNDPIIGIGPHRAVARWMAKQKHTDFEITELSKSDDLDINIVTELSKKFEHLLQEFNKRW
jgi:hypothetical protein